MSALVDEAGENDWAMTMLWMLASMDEPLSPEVRQKLRDRLDTIFTERRRKTEGMGRLAIEVRALIAAQYQVVWRLDELVERYKCKSREELFDRAWKEYVTRKK